MGPSSDTYPYSLTSRGPRRVPSNELASAWPPPPASSGVRKARRRQRRSGAGSAPSPDMALRVRRGARQQPSRVDTTWARRGNADRFRQRGSAAPCPNGRATQTQNVVGRVQSELVAAQHASGPWCQRWFCPPGCALAGTLPEGVDAQQTPNPISAPAPRRSGLSHLRLCPFQPLVWLKARAGSSELVSKHF